MSKEVTAVKSHYPDIISCLMANAKVAMIQAEFSTGCMEQFTRLLARAYEMGKRDGREQTEKELAYFVGASREYSEQITKLRESLHEIFGWFVEGGYDEYWDE